MAKYVCDFEQVKAQGEKLCKIAGDLSSAISTYSSASSSSLSSWQGPAATQFNQSNSSQIKTYTDNAQSLFPRIYSHNACSGWVKTNVNSTGSNCWAS